MTTPASLCFDPADDLLLARGYPHLARLVDGHPDDRKPAVAALKAINKPAHIALKLRIDWPRAVARHFVRAAHSKEFQSGSLQVPATVVVDGPELDEKEARVLIGRTVSIPGVNFLVRFRALVLLLEAMVGTEVVVDAILDGLEALPDRTWLTEPTPDRKTGGMAFTLGFLFLRLPPKLEAAQRARLRTLYAHVRAMIASKGKTESFELTNGVEMVLEGSKARKCQTPGPYTYLDRYVFAQDDLEMLRRVVGGKDTVYGTMDVQFVRHLGPEALTLMKKAPKADLLPSFLEDIGKIRAPEVVEQMVRFIDKSAAKGIPGAWLKRHADYARPILAAQKSERAKLALKACG